MCKKKKKTDYKSDIIIDLIWLSKNFTHWHRIINVKFEIKINHFVFVTFCFSFPSHHLLHPSLYLPQQLRGQASPWMHLSSISSTFTEDFVVTIFLFQFFNLSCTNSCFCFSFGSFNSTLFLLVLWYYCLILISWYYEFD